MQILKVIWYAGKKDADYRGFQSLEVMEVNELADQIVWFVFNLIAKGFWIFQNYVALEGAIIDLISLEQIPC